MRAPIVVRTEGDLFVYDSPEEAARWAEVVDVENGLYRGWDADGRPLDFEVVRERVRGRIRDRVAEQVQVVESPNEKPDPERLQRELVAYLNTYSKRSLDYTRLSTKELLSVARREFGR